MRSAIISVCAGIVLGVGLLCSAASAQAHWDSAERNRIFATLPNWAGLWESKFSADSNHLSGYAPISPAQFLVDIPLVGKPPYKAEWERQRQAAAKGAATPFKACVHVRFPFLLEGPFMFQVFVTPEETVFLYDNGEVRHIYTDGRKHPKKEDLWPTDTGHSIGRWDGSTLIVDTIDVQSGPLAPGIVELSDRAHFMERVWMKGPNRMEDDLTIDDPVRFAHPWHVLTVWTRVLDQDRLLPYDCDNDRNPVVNGQITIAPPR